MNYFLDTNIIIYAMKNSFPAIKDHFYNVPMQSIVIPEIVMAEIEYGARKSKSYKTTIEKYKKFTDNFCKRPFAEGASEAYGRIRSSLEKQGKLIGSNDMLIAAVVLAEDGILVTHNIKEFERVPQLKIEDWTN